MNKPQHQLNPELLQKHGTEVLNYLQERFNLLESTYIKPDLRPGELAAKFSTTAPQCAQSFETLMNDLENKIMPGLTQWQHPLSSSKAARVSGIRVRTIKAQMMNNGNYGSTNTCGYDDIDSFKGFAERENIWLHVDDALIHPFCMFGTASCSKMFL